MCTSPRNDAARGSGFRTGAGMIAGRQAGLKFGGSRWFLVISLEHQLLGSPDSSTGFRHRPGVPNPTLPDITYGCGELQGEDLQATVPHELAVHFSSILATH